MLLSFGLATVGKRFAQDRKAWLGSNGGCDGKR